MHHGLAAANRDAKRRRRVASAIRVASIAGCGAFAALSMPAAIAAEPAPVIGEALKQLGDFYRDGKVLPADGRRALEYYGRVASASDGSALFGVIAPADLIARTDAAAADGAAAAEVYTTAASLGETDALVRLGDLFADGSVVAAEPAKAFAYYRQAAGAGLDTGKVRVGEMLARGVGAAQDVESGRALVREVAETGNTTALIALGDLYSVGDAGPVDGAAAVAAYEKAVALGQPHGLLSLGDLFYYAAGKAVAVDLKKAFAYYQQAADAGNEVDRQIARMRVGTMLARGEGVAQDVERGRAMVREVADTGYTAALIALGDLYSRGDGGPVDAAAAVAAYEKAALADINARARPGDHYRDGTVAALDPARALGRRLGPARRDELFPASPEQ